MAFSLGGVRISVFFLNVKCINGNGEGVHISKVFKISGITLSMLRLLSSKAQGCKDF